MSGGGVEDVRLESEEKVERRASLCRFGSVGVFRPLLLAFLLLLSLRLVLFLVAVLRVL